MAKTVAVIVALAVGGAKAGPECPSSPWPHIVASTSVEVVMEKADCQLVVQEMMARIAGQPKTWHDPHNNGVYTVEKFDTDPAKNRFAFQRVTGNHQYTDRMLFTCQDQGCSADGTYCTAKFSGCSVSQVFSVLDFSTNYCNLRMLYCGSVVGCKPTTKYGDFNFEETFVSSSFGAGHSPGACLKDASMNSTIVV